MKKLAIIFMFLLLNSIVSARMIQEVEKPAFPYFNRIMSGVYNGTGYMLYVSSDSAITVSTSTTAGECLIGIGKKNIFDGPCYWQLEQFFNEETEKASIESRTVLKKYRRIHQMEREANFNELIGKTITSIKIEDDNEILTFITNDNRRYRMYHSQDCCEEVTIEDIDGDIIDLLGSPIVFAEEISSRDSFDEKKEEKVIDEFLNETFTWTFYKLGTSKGQVTIRWLGTSNGCYSEKVNFFEEKE